MLKLVDNNKDYHFYCIPYGTVELKEVIVRWLIEDEETGKKLTGAELLSVDLFKKALEEVDTAKKAKAFEVIRDSSGQKPVDKVEQTNTNITIDFGDLDDDQGAE